MLGILCKHRVTELGLGYTPQADGQTLSCPAHTSPAAHRAVQDPISIHVVQLEGDCEVFGELGQFMREIRRTHPSQGQAWWACNPSTWKVDFYEFKAMLLYIGSSRPARDS